MEIPVDFEGSSRIRKADSVSKFGFNSRQWRYGDLRLPDSSGFRTFPLDHTHWRLVGTTCADRYPIEKGKPVDVIDNAKTSNGRQLRAQFDKSENRKGMHRLKSTASQGVPLYPSNKRDRSIRQRKIITIITVFYPISIWRFAERLPITQ